MLWMNWAWFFWWDFRVLGLKLIPLLINLIFGYFSPFSLIYIFVWYYGFDFGFYFYFELYDFFFNFWLISCSYIYLSFIFISAGSIFTLVSLKVYFLGSMIIGNFLDIYIFGFLAVLMNWFFQVFYFDYLILSFIFYLFLHRLQVFLLILSLLESFSILFQSLTLSNRLSINLISGSLLINLLSVAVRLFLFYIILFILLWIVFSFEIFNSGIQLFIFSLLHLD